MQQRAPDGIIFAFCRYFEFSTLMVEYPTMSIVIEKKKLAEALSSFCKFQRLKPKLCLNIFLLCTYTKAKRVYRPIDLNWF